MDNAQNDTSGQNPNVKPTEIPKMTDMPGDNTDQLSGFSETLKERMELLGSLDIQLVIEVGRARIRMRELLDLKKGSVIELDKMAGDPVEIYANQKRIASGSIITANGRYCVRIHSILDQEKK